jgi:AraC family transcriptional regulator of arabinose operon
MDDRYFAYRRNGTRSWLLFYTVKGIGYFRFPNGRVQFANARQLVLYHPGVVHDYGTYPKAHWDFHWVHFMARPNWTSWLKWSSEEAWPGFAELIIPSKTLSKRIIQTFGELHRDLRMGGLWRREMALTAIEKILLIAAERTKSAGGRPLDPRVQSALETIAARPAYHYSVEELARQAHLTASGFAHLFKRQTGHSVIEYVLRTRLSEAARMLELTTAPVKEIAYTMGFSTPYHFSESFKRRYGKSPRAFRDRTR